MRAGVDAGVDAGVGWSAIRPDGAKVFKRLRVLARNKAFRLEPIEVDVLLHIPKSFLPTSNDSRERSMPPELLIGPRNIGPFQ